MSGVKLIGLFALEQLVKQSASMVNTRLKQHITKTMCANSLKQFFSKEVNTFDTMGPLVQDIAKELACIVRNMLICMVTIELSSEFKLL